ncbi:MAG: chromosomal replication initiator protein DnaA [Verrucomicrobiales bacterium]|nr:chromosomal replication initiator protein DnaA [Verrucomicrobiales bacterium]
MHPDSDSEPRQPTEKQNLKTLWNRISDDLRNALGDSTYELFLPNFKLSTMDNTEAVIEVPGSGYAFWAESNFKETILLTLQKHIPVCESFRFDVLDEEETVVEKKPKSDKNKNKVTKVKSRVLTEKISEKKLLERGRAAGLVELFRFDNFVPGENSELAWAASQAVANEPGKTYQPLFFHSACGLGKTHLLHGIGWASLEKRPKSKIIFVTAEQFSNDYIDAIQKNALVSFRKKYREADLLLIDDVQFFGRKEGLQQEFFHTFNRLSDLGRQIVLASDCPAGEISALEDRLISRFQWGLSVEIHRPELETRAAILRRKRDDWNMQVSDELINAIVERVKGNVRVLEGALIRVAMVTTMNDAEVDPSKIDEILSDIIGGSASSSQLGIEEIKQAVSEHYDIEVSVLNGKKRTARVAEARHVAMYLMRELTDLSLMDVAASFGKDHGTVIHAVKRVKAKFQTSTSFKGSVELIKRRLLRGGSSIESKRNRRSSRPKGKSDKLDANRYREKYSG